MTQRNIGRWRTQIQVVQIGLQRGSYITTSDNRPGQTGIGGIDVWQLKAKQPTKIEKTTKSNHQIRREAIYTHTHHSPEHDFSNGSKIHAQPLPSLRSHLPE